MAQVGYHDYHRVQIHNPDTSFVSTFGEYGTGDGQFVYPFHPVFDASGYVYVPDQTRVQQFTLTGEWQQTFSFPVTAGYVLRIGGAAFDITRNRLQVITAQTNNVGDATTILHYYEIDPLTGVCTLDIPLFLQRSPAESPIRYYLYQFRGGLAVTGNRIVTAGWASSPPSWISGRTNTRHGICTWDFSGRPQEFCPIQPIETASIDLHIDGADICFTTFDLESYQTVNSGFTAISTIYEKPNSNPPDTSAGLLYSGIRADTRLYLCGEVTAIMGEITADREPHCGRYELSGTYTLVNGFGRPGYGDGEYGIAAAVTISPGGYLYICDWNELPNGTDPDGDGDSDDEGDQDDDETPTDDNIGRRRQSLVAKTDPIFGFHHLCYETQFQIYHSREWTGQSNWSTFTDVGSGMKPGLVVLPDRTLDVPIEFGGMVVAHQYSRDFGRTWSSE